MQDKGSLECLIEMCDGDEKQTFLFQNQEDLLTLIKVSDQDNVTQFF